MRRKALYSLAAVLVAYGAFALCPPAPGAPRDRPITLSPDAPVRVVAFGTSLTALYDWPEHLQTALAQCLNQPVTVAKIAKPGQSVAWAEAQLETVLAENPDLVLIEFSINDADLRDGVSLRDSIATHERILSRLATPAKRPKILLMTMSPAHGARGLIRPRLWAYYDSYHALAERFDTGLVDAYPRWRAVPQWTERFADGLHPDPASVDQILLPAVMNTLGCSAG